MLCKVVSFGTSHLTRAAFDPNSTHTDKADNEKEANSFECGVDVEGKAVRQRRHRELAKAMFVTPCFIRSHFICEMTKAMILEIRAEKSKKKTERVDDNHGGGKKTEWGVAIVASRCVNEACVHYSDEINKDHHHIAEEITLVVHLYIVHIKDTKVIIH